MSQDDRKISRREALAGVAAALAAGLTPVRLRATAPRGDGQDSPAAAVKSRVIRVESEAVWKGDQRDPETVRKMIHRGLVELTGAKSPEAAWKAVFTPDMKVGLKINLLGRPWVYTAPEITAVVAAGAVAAGVKPENLFVWERYADHFRQTGYKLGSNFSGGLVRAGRVYDKERAAQTKSGSAALDAIPSTETDTTVNLCVLKDHGGAGITGALKNIAFGCYEHTWGAHQNNCDPYIVEAYGHFVQHQKTPLIVLDATDACFDGGPVPSNASDRWRDNAVYLAIDPVALDQVAMERIMAKRREMNRSDRTSACTHIATAAAAGLGTNDPQRIELKVVRV
jgi:uncharacterized protein (DUF362 family)